MADAESFDPALLAQGQPDEKAQLDQFRYREMLIEFLPKSIVGNIGVPRDGARIGQRDFLALGELVRIGKIQQFVILVFRESLPSSLDGALNPSIFAVNRF